MANWRKLYSAQVVESFAPYGMTRHLRVKRNDGKSGISWDVLQLIKDEMLGAEVWAVEVYPPSSGVVNETNMRHLWEMPGNLCPNLLNRVKE